MNATHLLSELFDVMQMLCLVQSAPTTEIEDRERAEYLAQLGEFTAHQQILRLLRALRAAVDDARLEEFEAAYMRQPSEVYHDPEALQDDAGIGWCLVDPGAAAKLRPRLIASVAGLLASQTVRLNSDAFRERLKSAPAAEGACTVVSQLCGELGVWLRRQPSVGEESLTDWLLYQLTERAAWIRYLKFT
jgi:hypothetical protein